MARIRSIKPEFWTSEQIIECSPITRLMFIGIWNFSDDSGRMPVSVKTIKFRLFPGDDISFENIQGMITELSVNGLIRLYEVDDVAFLQVTGWERHQKINRPQPSKHPAPPNKNSRSVKIQGAITERSLVEGDGREMDQGGGSRNAAPNGARDAVFENLPTDRAPDPEIELFRRGKEVLGKNAGGLIKDLLKARDNKVALARAAIEQASTKENPREYVGAIIRGRTDTEPPRVIL